MMIIQTPDVFDRPKRSMFGTVFHWLFGRLGGTDQNVEQLKSNVDNPDGQSKHPAGTN